MGEPPVQPNHKGMVLGVSARGILRDLSVITIRTNTINGGIEVGVEREVRSLAAGVSGSDQQIRHYFPLYRKVPGPDGRWLPVAGIRHCDDGQLECSIRTRHLRSILRRKWI